MAEWAAERALGKVYLQTIGKMMKRLTGLSFQVEMDLIPFQYRPLILCFFWFVCHGVIAINIITPQEMGVVRSLNRSPHTRLNSDSMHTR